MAGGKWTSYRRMAQSAVEQAVAAFQLAPRAPSRTAMVKLLGSREFDSGKILQELAQRGFSPDIAEYLLRSHGDHALRVSELAKRELSARLHPDHPALEAEVVYAVREEYAERALDVLCRRTPLGVLDEKAALEAAPRVIALMAEELGWDEKRREEELVAVEEGLPLLG